MRHLATFNIIFQVDRQSRLGISRKCLSLCVVLSSCKPAHLEGITLLAGMDIHRVVGCCDWLQHWRDLGHDFS